MATKTFELWHVYYGISNDYPVRIVGRNVGRPNSKLDYVITSDLAGNNTAIYPILTNHDKEWLVSAPKNANDADVDRDGAVMADITCIDWCNDVTDYCPDFPIPSA